MDIRKLIIHEIETCGKSRYRISADTGVDASVLCKILQGKRSMHVETIDRLLPYFGYEIVKRRKARE